MKSNKRLAALVLGTAISVSTVLAAVPGTAYAAVWEKMANGGPRF